MRLVGLLLHLLGLLLAALPETLLRGFAVALGRLMWWIPNRRKRIQQANLRLAFPDRGNAWLAAMGRENFARLIEYGLFMLANPAMSEARLRRCVQLGPNIEPLAQRVAGQPVVIFVPHVTLLESLTFLSRLLPQNPIAAIFRPLRNEALSRIVLGPRERWGMKLIGRRGGLMEAANFLRRGGWLAVIADQNTGASGTLVLFLGRPCSATPLPENLLRQHGGTFVGLIVRRTGFFRAEVDAEPIPCDPSAEGDVTIAGNSWLERQLRTDDSLVADWFWSHRRWRVLHEPRTCFRIAHKRNAIPRQLAALGLTAWPRNTRVVVIPPPPSQPAARAALVPLLARLRRSRPDFEITLWDEATAASGSNSASASASLAAPASAVAADSVSATPPAAASAYQASTRPWPSDAVDRTVAPTPDNLRAEAARWPEYVLLLDPDPRWTQPVRRLRAAHIFGPSPSAGQSFQAVTQPAPVTASPNSAAWLEPLFLHFGLPPPGE